MASKAEMSLVFVLVCAMLTIDQTSSERDCYHEKIKFKKKCMAFVEKGVSYINPSSSCCQTIREVDMTCVCGIITPEEEKEINVHRMVWIAHVCGNPVLPGNKCGS